MATEKQIDAVTGKITEISYTQPTVSADDKLSDLREWRNRLLLETDVWALSDRTMTEEQKKYRQDLRDITKTATSLDDVKWPDKP
jgi:hypothetical protein|tara:strand:- start:602 stop:856 length:255 start_codon:yes stop_codon:yes gene_type:complete